MRPAKGRLPSGRALGTGAAALFSLSALALVLHDSPPPRPVVPEPAAQEGVTAQALEEVAPEGVAPAPATTVPVEKPRPAPKKAAPKPKAPPPRRPAPQVSAGTAPYRGMGTWVDVYDWSVTFARPAQPRLSPSVVDAMADEGVQTLYIQASKHDSPSHVLEPELLREWIDRAKGRGIRVVAWYLPTLVDTGRDLARMQAIAALPVDGVAVDIESKDVADLGERNSRLVVFSTALRKALPGRAIGGIVLPPVVLEAVNPKYWPAFPYRQLAPLYDVWMTMGYWTNRPAGSAYRDANLYTMENVNRLRANLGLPDALVHPIGGIGDRTTAVDVAGYRKAVSDTGSIGGSLYDWRTTKPALWEGLRSFRR